jgi:deoxyribonuclease-4
MPLFGAHMSIAKGCHNALLAAHRYGCEAVQLFTKNSNQWEAKPLTDDDVEQFRRARQESSPRVLVSHDSYLINLASPDKELYRRSVEAFADEVRRAEALGLDYLVFHPGAATDGDEDAGLKRVAKALNEVHRRCWGFRVQVLVETTAGQGRCLGHRFEHIARILALVKQPERLGVCLDTCHVFAAGYPLAPEEEYNATIEALDRAVGLDRLKVFHVNDSAKPLGSRVDRHAHVGKGCLGTEPFRLLVNDPRFADRPMILETPKEGDDGEDMDAVNLAALRSLLKSRRPAQVPPRPGR